MEQKNIDQGISNSERNEEIKMQSKNFNPALNISYFIS